MKTLVVGAGALGGLVGAQLTAAGEDVVLVEINEARARLLDETGLFISEGTKGERCFPIRVVSTLDGLPTMDLVFVSVKSYQTEAAVRGVLPVVGDHSLVLSMQNGIGNTRAMADVLGPERVLSGITYHSIQHVGPNRLRYRAGIKPIQIAPYDGRVTPEVEAVGEVFRHAGLATDVIDNIDHTVWQKLLHNAVVNPVSALSGRTCNELLADDDLQAFMRAMCDEIIAVMRARGVPIIDEEDPYRPVIGSQRALGNNRPSMWQDLSRGVPTEVDAINGAVVDEAERLGLEAPLNWGVTRFIHATERGIVERRRRAQRTATAVSEARRATTELPVHTVTRATDRAENGGMPRERVPLESTVRLKELVRSYYRDLDEAGRDPERRVAWCSGLGPCELLRAFGFDLYFPENHAALIGASRRAHRYVARAVAEGFSPLASTQTTCDIGAHLAGDSPLVPVHGIDGPPRPDAVVYNTSFGHSLIHWFEWYGGHFDVPVLGLHPPSVLDDLEEADVDASVRHLERLAGRLEALADRRLDRGRLAEAVRHAARAATLWAQILDLATQVPSPLTVFDTLVHMAPLVMLRGTPEAADYYALLLSELEERVAAGVAAVADERHRLYWEGPPVWCALGPMAKLFSERRICVVASTYPSVFALEGLDPDRPFQSMAESYTGLFTNRSRRHKRGVLSERLQRYRVDALLHHDGRTCPEHSNVRHGLHVELERETGVPALVLEADSHDVRHFSAAQLAALLDEWLAGAERRAG